MPISKKFLKDGTCKVTFRVPAKEASSVSVIGDFNDWSTEATPLTKLKNGTFKGELSFQKGNSHEFRYVVDGNYTNETEADGFKWNDFAATENCILDLSC